MQVTPLEKDVVPLGGLKEVKNQADVELLLLGHLVVFLDLPKHAND